MDELSRCARGVRVFASKARSGLTPLLPGLVCGWGRKIGWGSVPPFYTKGVTTYYIDVLQWAARHQASAR